MILNKILEIWITTKCFISKKLCYIHDFVDDLEFYRKNYNNYVKIDDLKKIGIEYKQDKLVGLQFDWQFDSISIYNKKGGDCNSLNRLTLLHNYININTSGEFYLLTYIAKDFNKSHTICVELGINKCKVYDYGQFIFECNNNKLIEVIESTYNIKVLGYCIQDKNWSIKKIKNIC